LLEQLDYDPENNEVAEHFSILKENSDCLFAKSSKIWTAHPWNPRLSLEDNIISNIKGLEVCVRCGVNLGLDGFLFEITGEEYFRNVEIFGQTIRRTLTVIGENDPSHSNCMKKSYIDKRGWYFEFAEESMFVTTFAPCYEKDSSRYTFDCSPKSCWILLQPDYSFTRHNIGPETAETNWNNPKTMRDKIRCEFKAHSRAYEIPSVVAYPPAHHIVKPLHVGMPVVTWWL